MNLDGQIQLLLAAVLVSVIGASLVMLALPAKMSSSEAVAEEGVTSTGAVITPIRAVRVIVASPYYR